MYQRKKLKSIIAKILILAFIGSMGVTMIAPLMPVGTVYADPPATPTPDPGTTEEPTTEATEKTTSSGGASVTAQYNDPNFSFYRVSIFGRQFLNAWAYVSRHKSLDGGTTGVGTGSGGASGDGAEVASDPSADVISAVKTLSEKFKFDTNNAFFVNTTASGTGTSSIGTGNNGGFTGAFFSGNANPDSIKREGNLFGGDLTDAMKMADGGVGGSVSSNTEWTFSYSDMVLSLKNSGSGSAQVIDGRAYGYYGAALNYLGFDKVSANFNQNGGFGDKLNKIVATVFYNELKLTRIVNSLFKITAEILRSLNPFSVFSTKTDPILTDEAMSRNLYFDFVNEYGGFFDMAKRIAMVIFSVVIVVSFAYNLASPQGNISHWFKSTIIKIAFIGLFVGGVGSISTFLLDSVVDMYADADGLATNMIDDTFAVYVDFENWMKNSRLALPDGVNLVWNVESNAVDGINMTGNVSIRTLEESRTRIKAVLDKARKRGNAKMVELYTARLSDINSQIATARREASSTTKREDMNARIADLALLINQNTYYNSLESISSGSSLVLDAMKNGQDYASISSGEISDLDDDKKKVIEIYDSLIDSLFTRYLTNAKLDPGAYESYIRAGKDFQSYINGTGGRKAANWQIEQKELQNDPSLFGQMTVAENLASSPAYGKIPLISRLYAINSTSGIFYKPIGNSRVIIETSSMGGTEISGYDRYRYVDSDTSTTIKRYANDGTTLEGNYPMSVMTAYNYLSSSFGATSFTYTNPSNLNTTYAKGSHESVVMPGDVSSWLSLAKSVIKYGIFIALVFLFSLALIVSSFKRGLILFTQTPLALAGFLTFIVKAFVTVIMGLGEILITIFFYFITFNVINVLAGSGLNRVLGSIDGTALSTLFNGGRSGALNVADLLSIALLILFFMTALKYRGAIIDALDLVLESSMNKIVGVVAPSRGLDLGMGSSASSIDSAITGITKNAMVFSAAAGGSLLGIAKKHPGAVGMGLLGGSAMMSSMLGSSLAKNGTDPLDLKDKGKKIADTGLNFGMDKDDKDNKDKNKNPIMSAINGDLDASKNKPMNTASFNPLQSAIGGSTIPNPEMEGRADKSSVVDDKNQNVLPVDQNMIDSNNPKYMVDGYSRDGYKDGVDRQGYDSNGTKFVNGESVDRQGRIASGQAPVYSDYNDEHTKPYTDPMTLKQVSDIPNDPVTGASAKMDAQGYTPAGNGMPGFRRDENGTWRDRAGYDAHGLDKDGVARDGYSYTVNPNGTLTKGSQVYDSDGFKTTATGEKVDRNGFNEYGYKADSRGTMRDINGADKTGRDQFGNQMYNAMGYTKDGYNKFGMDANGFDKSGYNAQGFDRQGFDANGFDKDGNGKYPWMGNISSSPMMLGGVSSGGSSGIYNTTNNASSNGKSSAFVDNSIKGYDGRSNMSVNFSEMKRSDANAIAGMNAADVDNKLNGIGSAINNLNNLNANANNNLNMGNTLSNLKDMTDNNISDVKNKGNVAGMPQPIKIPKGSLGNIKPLTSNDAKEQVSKTKK